MQHAYGHPLHRSTLWRRSKALAGPIGKAKLGRAYADDRKARNFLGFTGAVISLVNETGHCDYPEIWQQRSRSYRETPPALFKKLVACGYPPAMLAVAICEIVPLNFITRRGAQSLKPSVYEAAEAELKRKGAVTPEGMITAVQRKKIQADLKEQGYSEHDIRTILHEAQKANFKGWVSEFFREYRTSEERHARGEPTLVSSHEVDLEPAKVEDDDEPRTISRRFRIRGRVKGTPAHRVRFSGGASISRRMACHWRRHPQFKACVRFLYSLFECEPPHAPSTKRISLPHPPEFESQVRQALRLRREAKRA